MRARDLGCVGYRRVVGGGSEGSARERRYGARTRRRAAYFARASVLVALLSAYAVAPGVAVTQEWTGPESVAPDSGWPPVAVGAPGDGQIVFADDSPAQLLSVRRSGVRFLSPQTFLAPPPSPEGLRYGFDDVGNATFVYSTGSGISAQVVVRVRSASGRLGREHVIATPGRGAGLGVIAVARSGAAVVAWPRRSSGGWLIQAATRDPGGEFGRPRTVSGPSRVRQQPWVAVGDAGDALVVWHRQNHGSDRHVRGQERLWASARQRGRRFSSPSVLGQGGDWSDVAVSVSGNGRMLAAWIPFNYRHQASERSRLEVAERRTNTVFTPARTIAAATTPNALDEPGPAAAIADNGSAIVAWLRPTGGFGEFAGRGRVEALTRPPSGEFVLQTLSGPERAPAAPVLAVGPGGQAILAWTEAPRDALGWSANALPMAAMTVIGSEFPHAAALSTVVETTTECECARWPSVAVTDDGDAIVAWAGADSLRAAVRAAGGRSARAPAHR